MKLSVSNIAWAPEEAETAYGLLRDAGAAGLEIAPGLFFPQEPDPMTATDAACAEAIAQAARFGLTLSSMQSLLFGTDGAELFGPPPARQKLEQAMRKVIALAGRLSVPNLVFGSPKNRIIPDGMSRDAARAIWRDTFRRLGDAAQDAGTVIALEPNPVAYGTNFMTGFAETLDVARDVDHPGIRVNLDLGALLMTGEIETLEHWLPAAMPMVNHVHLSAPNLAPLATETTAVQRLLDALHDAGWQGWVSIEMRRGLQDLPAALAACTR